MIRLATLAWVVAVGATAQTMDFSALAAKAKSKTEVSLDGAVLDAARKAMPQGEKLAGVRAMRVHAYEYAKEGDYPMAAVDAIVKQVESDGSWKRIVNAREEKERVDIFLKMAAGKVEGLVLVAAEAKEVAVIQAEGSVELAAMKEVVASAIEFDMAALGNPAGK